MDTKERLILQKSSDIATICKPLFDNMPVNFFHYFRVYKDGGLFMLASNLLWLEHYFSMKYYEISSFRDYPKENNEKYKLTNTLERSAPIVKDALKIFSIGDGIIFISPQDSFCEFFLICTNSSYNEPHQFFLNHLDFLKKFTLYFKDKAHPLLIKAPTDALFIPPNNQENMSVSTYQTKNNLSLLEPKRYYLNDSTYLTKKEVEYAYWLAKGKTSGEIAILYSCSIRTIEKHIENMKNKLGLYKVTSLVLHMKELGFI